MSAEHDTSPVPDRPLNALRDEKSIYTYIQRMDYRKLKNHLSYLASSTPGGEGQTGTTGTIVDITQIYDRKGYTPIHFAAF